MAKIGLREQIAQEFIAALEAEKIPWRAMWKGQKPYNAATGKDYRGVNALWLSFVACMKGYSDPRWCTFNQASENGWHVRKGEKSVHVEYWGVYDKATKKNISLSEANRICGADPERKDDLRIVAKSYCVFNAEQIEGIPALEQAVPSAGIEVIRGQRDVLIANMGLGFREGGDSAFYSPSSDSITMPPDVSFESPYGYMATLLHECGHATGHSSRLNRDLSGRFGSESYAKEELRAEIASAFTSQALGMDTDAGSFASEMDNHKAYIQSWISVIKDKPNELFAAIKDAEAISDYLIEKGEFQLPERASKEPETLDEQIDRARTVEVTQGQGRAVERSR